MSHSQCREKSGEVLEKMQVNGLEGAPQCIMCLCIKSCDRTAMYYVCVHPGIKYQTHVLCMHSLKDKSVIEHNVCIHSRT